MARAALEDARAAVASFFRTRPRQVVFTSGATEAINAATYGALWDSPGMAVLADVEHSAVREASALWATSLVSVGVDRSGRIAVDELASVLASRPEVRLVQCQLANHEVGSLQPVAQVASLCRAAGVMLHVDAAAAAGRVPIDFDRLGVDLMSVSAHKMGGPAGVGAMLVRRGLRVPPLIVGGSQERARRAGLENVAAAAGFGAVAGYLSSPAPPLPSSPAPPSPSSSLEDGGSADGSGEETSVLSAESREAAAQVDRLREAVTSIPGVTAYGPSSPDDRLPHLLCVGIEGVEAEGVLVGLDRAGVAAHSGSSCSSELLEPSPVLLAMGVDGERSLRLSVGWSTTDEEVELAAAAFRRVVEELRRLRGA